jgi:hypothetical protein
VQFTFCTRHAVMGFCEGLVTVIFEDMLRLVRGLGIVGKLQYIGVSIIEHHTGKLDQFNIPMYNLNSQIEW